MGCWRQASSPTKALRAAQNIQDRALVKACVSGPARCSSEEPGLILVFLGGWSEREQGSMGRAGCVDPYGRKRLQIHAWASGVQGHHSRDGLISGQHQISWGWLDKSMW